MGFRLVIPIKIVNNSTASVINPRKCTMCGRLYKPATVADKSEECYECRTYLDERAKDE